MKIIGIDLDSKKICIVLLEDGNLKACYTIGSDLKKKAMERAKELIDKFEKFCEEMRLEGIDHVVFESPIYVQNFLSSKIITGLTFACEYFCHKYWDILTLSVANTTWKKYAIGKGNATKQEIKDFMLAKYPELEGSGQDIFDASAMALYGWNIFSEGLNV